MRPQVPMFEFSEDAFVVGSESLVCVARVSDLLPYMTLAEIDRAFSGYASYRQWPWMRRYVGVWGRKNCQRFRRFLRERGADVALHRERPDRLRLSSYLTRGKRSRLRSIGDLGA